MGKLFLASVGGKVLNKIISLLGKNPNELTVAFVPTAADPYKDKWYIKEDRDALVKVGFKVFDLDIKDKTEKEIRIDLNRANIIFVAGGNSFYLLEKSNESGFPKAVKDFVDQGKDYIGSSAGSVLAGPNIQPVDVFDDPKDAPNLKSTKGLGLTDIVILPHYGDMKELPLFNKVIRKWESKYTLVTITNDQLVFISDTEIKIL